jgi:hypothetical protein
MFIQVGAKLHGDGAITNGGVRKIHDVRILRLLVETALSAAPAPGGYGAKLKARVKRDDDDTGGDQKIFHMRAPRKTLPMGKQPKRPAFSVPQPFLRLLVNQDRWSSYAAFATRR